MRLALLLVVCACNQVFGLHQTEQTAPIDAQLFDAPPVTCPAIGTVPQFSPLLHQVTTQKCFGYSESVTANLAVAYCAGVISEGPIGGTFTDSGLNVSASLIFPQISPEGDELWVGQEDFSIAVYQRSGNSWQPKSRLPIPTYMAGNFITPPTLRGEHARRFLQLSFSDAGLHEYEERGPGDWTEISPVYFPAAGTTHVNQLALSADGLHLVVDAAVGSMGGRYYADRAAITDRFGPLAPLTTAPSVLQQPFLSQDCGRIYTDGFGYIFYIQRQ